MQIIPFSVVTTCRPAVGLIFNYTTATRPNRKIVLYRDSHENDFIAERERVCHSTRLFCHQQGEIVLVDAGALLPSQYVDRSRLNRGGFKRYGKQFRTKTISVTLSFSMTISIGVCGYCCSSIPFFYQHYVPFLINFAIHIGKL